ncbi:MAG: pallilysin-related adhesin [Treponema sp.]|nr:pallilysin-related adhesin [Treponema sp.]
MKSKFIAVVFVLAAAALGVFFFFSKKNSGIEGENTKQAKIVNPKFSEEVMSDSGRTEASVEQETFTSFIPLSGSETLISTLIFDFDNDTYEDQVIVVRKADSPYLWLVIGLYDSETKDYNRITDIRTNISKTGTFTYSNLDVIGNHTQALIYQGVEDSGDYVMNIFICKGNGLEAEIVNVGSFASDGTVFIQQTERADSYELALSNGESFSVWVYSSDNAGKSPEELAEKKSATNQIQTEYRWNSFNQKYEFNRSTTVTASRLAARELSRIQDGTVETFAAFMDGLWYKTSNTDNTIRYLCFSYPDKEIIFLNGDTEEVYNWEDSKLRHNGIYLTTTNSIISSLHRRFDIMLVGVDEIRVTVRDDVHMVIAEGSLWDGNYKKTSSGYNFAQSVAAVKETGFAQKITSRKWTALDGTALSFDGNRYSVTSGQDSEKGIYSIFSVGDENVIQLRPSSGYSELGSEYVMTFGTKIITETQKKKTIEKVVTDEDTLILAPVKVTPKECYPVDGRNWQFSAVINQPE